jgi:hypothetical protein
LRDLNERQLLTLHDVNGRRDWWMVNSIGVDGMVVNAP